MVMKASDITDFAKSLLSMIEDLENSRKDQEQLRKSLDEKSVQEVQAVQEVRKVKGELEKYKGLDRDFNKVEKHMKNYKETLERLVDALGKWSSNKNNPTTVENLRESYQGAKNIIQNENID